MLQKIFSLCDSFVGVLHCMFMCGETVVKYTRTMREGIEAQPAYWNSFVRPREKNPLPRFPPLPPPPPLRGLRRWLCLTKGCNSGALSLSFSCLYLFLCLGSLSLSLSSSVFLVSVCRVYSNTAV